MQRSLLAVAAGYLLGTLPSADLASRLAGTQVRTAGTGNPGAVNAAVVLGRRWGLAVLVADVGKGWAAGVLGQRVGPATSCAAATAAVVGHVFPLWSRGRGGKGVATSYGAVLGCFPAYALPDAAVAALAARATRDPRRANDAASLVWTAAALLWWRRGWPTLWGPPATAALPLSAAATSALLAWRLRQPERVRGGARLGGSGGTGGVTGAGAGTPAGMSEPEEPTGMAATAAKSIEESVQEERAAVGDSPDTGGLVPPDDAQSAPPQR